MQHAHSIEIVCCVSERRAAKRLVEPTFVLGLTASSSAPGLLKSTRVTSTLMVCSTIWLMAHERQNSVESTHSADNLSALGAEQRRGGLRASHTDVK